MGSIILPFLLTDCMTGQRFRMKLYAHVVTGLLVPVFIGRAGLKSLVGETWKDGTIKYSFKFPNGKKAVVEGFVPS
jgi:hypothetical protein